MPVIIGRPPPQAPAPPPPPKDPGIEGAVEGWNQQAQAGIPLQPPQAGASQGFNPSNPSAATAPGYQNPYDPSTMSDVAELQKLGPQYDQGFDALRDQATNKGQSQWLSMSELQNQMQMQDALNKAQQSSAAATGGQMDSLASMGGLSSGARERAQEQGGVNLMNMQQGAERANQEGQVGLETQDQSNRMNQLNTLVSDENAKQNQWNQAFSTDVQAGEQNVQQQNAFNMNMYNQQMQAWGAAQQAAATANAGKK
jgi:hypothetical protein